MKNIYLPFLFSIVTICFGFFIPDTTHAMLIRGEQTFVLEEYATLEDDLYVAGQLISLKGTTTGDVFSAGSKVIHSGVVTEDLFIAGGEVEVAGEVHGDLRILGGKVFLSGRFMEDVIVIGGTVVLSEDVVIEGDVLVVAESLVSSASTTGIVEVYSRVAEFTGGIIGGGLRAHTRESLSVTGTTRIEGNLEYKAPQEAFVSETATVEGERFYTQLDVNRTDRSRVDLIGLVQLILVAVGAAVALAFFFPAHTRAMADIALRKNNFASFIKGFLVLMAVPIASVLIMMTMIGIIPGLIMLFVYIVLLCVALALSPVLAGIFLARAFKKGDEELSFAWVSFGAITFTLISLLPYIGFAVRLLIFLLALYAVSVLLYEHVWVQRKKLQLEAEKKPHHDKEARDKEETTTNA